LEAAKVEVAYFGGHLLAAARYQRMDSVLLLEIMA
jgi:hypothetical protein